MSLSSPLGLMRHLRRPDMRMDIVPWFNVLLVGWMFTLLGSRFIFAPGVAVDVGPDGAPAPVRLNLPVVPGGALPGRATDIVVTVRMTSKSVPSFAIGNGIHAMQGLTEPLRNARASLPKDASPVILLKSDGALPLESFLQFCELARAAGFSVQVAARDTPEPEPAGNP